MAINAVMRAALKALSYPDIDIKKNYELGRFFTNAAHIHYLSSLYQKWDHVVSVGDHDVPVRIYAPVNSTLAPLKGKRNSLLLFFHGGGWVTGNIDSYDKVCTHLARHTSSLVLSVDYSLAPEHRFPAGLNDCYQVAREIFLKKGLFDIPVKDITLIGDSAGANLAAAVSLMARDRGEFLPEKQVLLYPSTYNDHTKSSPFPSIKENGTDYLLTSKRICDYLELYLGSMEDLNNPYFAPLLAGDFSHQPKTLLITAEFDPLRDEGEAYAEMLERDGGTVELHRVPDALHGFFSLPPRYEQVRQCYSWISHFLHTNG